MVRHGFPIDGAETELRLYFQVYPGFYRIEVGVDADGDGNPDGAGVLVGWSSEQIALRTSRSRAQRAASTCSDSPSEVTSGPVVDVAAYRYRGAPSRGPYEAR